jgi:hypothetical protein
MKEELVLPLSIMVGLSLYDSYFSEFVIDKTSRKVIKQLEG